MSKKLAIQGHPTRGNEVIELLVMMGGDNRWKASGSIEKVYYSISNGGILYSPQLEKGSIVFTLEKFLTKYPFKVGDKVMCKHSGNILTIKSMEWSADCETMVYDFKDSVIVLAAEDMKLVNDNKLSSAVENPDEFKSYTVSLKDGEAIGNSIDSVQFVQSGKIVAVRFNTQNYENEVELQLDDYEIEIRDGKTYAVRKKPKYPKLTNLTECKEILGEKDIYQSVSGYKGELLTSFQLLFIFRDVYWKIAGEELGLGKPWEPNWQKTEERKFCIIRRSDNTVTKWETKTIAKFLAFPTAEMRDAFYENFKKLIEQCKELL